MQHATYKPNPNERIIVGESALVDVIEHPTCSHCTVRTTEVLSYEESTGIFVTDNTEFHPIIDAVPVQAIIEPVVPDAAEDELEVPVPLPEPVPLPQELPTIQTPVKKVKA
jgi:hypothetical protein